MCWSSAAQLRKTTTALSCRCCSTLVAASTVCSSSLSKPTASSLKGSLSFTPDRRRLQRLRACAPFASAFSVPPSPEKEPSCLASLPSAARLPQLLSQQRSSQLTMCSPGGQLQSCPMARSSPRDGDHLLPAALLSALLSNSLLFPGMALPWGRLPRLPLAPSPSWEDLLPFQNEMTSACIPSPCVYWRLRQQRGRPRSQLLGPVPGLEGLQGTCQGLEGLQGE